MKDKSMRDSILIARNVYAGYDENQGDIAEALTEMISRLYDLKPGYQMLRIFSMIIGTRDVPDTDAQTELTVAGG